jgi:hypothetical protein
VDTSAFTGSLNRVSGSRLDKKIGIYQNSFDSLKYWNTSLNVGDDGSKVYVTGSCMNEILPTSHYSYKKANKNGSSGDVVGLRRLVDGQLKEQRRLHSFLYENDRVVSLGMDQQEAYMDLASFNVDLVKNVNIGLKNRGKSDLSKPDLDLFYSAAAIGKAGAKSALIVRAFGMFYLAKDFLRKNPDSNMDVYLHSSIGNFDVCDFGK